MLKKVIVPILLGCLLVLVGCESQPTEPAATTAPAGNVPAAAVAGAVSVPEYVSGFHNLETSPDGKSWRWMSADGRVKLKNTKSDMRLKLVGDLASDLFGPAPVEVTVKLNGETLDTWKLNKETAVFDKEYTVSAAKQTGDFSELEIHASKSFVPKEIHKSSNDTRPLSLSFSKLDWSAK